MDRRFAVFLVVRPLCMLIPLEVPVDSHGEMNEIILFRVSLELFLAMPR